MGLTNLSNERLLADTIGRLRHVTPAHRARWGRLNAHQMLCHLADACRVALGERDAAPGAMPAAKRHFVRLVAFHTPLPWPRNLHTMAEVDPARQGTRPGDFDADLRTAIELLTRVATDSGIDGHPHPMFGPLSRREWLRWAWMHTEHHLRQFGV